MRKLIILAAAQILSGCGHQEEKGPEHPNIVLFITDDQGWGDLSFTGNRNLNTPNIDSLAGEGTYFDRFFVCPVSSPTRAELLTGRYHPHGNVFSTGGGGERLDLDETTMGEVFRNAGYATAAFGKWHNGMQYPYHPNARGFDEFYGFCSGHWGNYFSPVLEHNGRIVQGEGYVTDDFTSRALEFMEEHRGGPFFVYLPYNIPHSPMQVPSRWWKPFEGKAPEMRHRDPEKEDIRHTRAALAMCENIDWNVGRVLRKMEELEIRDNTIVLYFSDNGPNGWRWNGGMKGKKGWTDEGGVRSPMFISWPGVIRAGKTVDRIAGAIDILPTLADLAGIELQTKKPVEGVSLKPLLTDPGAPWEDRLLYHYWGNKLSVRSQRYRLDYEGQLFDMVIDPGQKQDISGELPGKVSELSKAAEIWKESVLSELEPGARPFPVGHPDYRYTQIPARDGKSHGHIERSNFYPNCSFFTHWIHTEDSITWDIEVLSEGDYRVELYYTLPRESTGCIMQLTFRSGRLVREISRAHDPPLKGMERDRVERIESYVKDFRPLDMGTIHLEKGRGPLVLKTLDIPGPQAIDFRLFMFTRIGQDE